MLISVRPSTYPDQHAPGLDLSRNGGGLLEEAVKISGLFIRTGGVVATNGALGLSLARGDYRRPSLGRL